MARLTRQRRRSLPSLPSPPSPVARAPGENGPRENARMCKNLSIVAGVVVVAVFSTF